MKLISIAVVAALPLGACGAGTGLGAPAMTAATGAPLTLAVRIPEPVAAEIAAPPGLAAPGEVRIAAFKRTSKRRGGPPMARVNAANQAALREPAGDDYLNAAQVYSFSPGALYRLYTAPGRVSDIALEPGEALVSVAAGDTARWIIGDTMSGSGAGQRTHILVKPAAAGLDTNLVIATDRRVYHVQVESSAGTAMASISWTYPADGLLAVTGTGAPRAGGAPGIPPSAGSRFDYRIEGDRPAWRPVRAFDDGRQLFIEFPASFATGEAPPLFVSAADGGTALVNYRVRGRYYVVDQLFQSAELRLGEGRQQVVRIIRVEHGRTRRRGRPS